MSAEDINVSLQRLIGRIKTTQVQIANDQKEILGLAISVRDLDDKIRRPGLEGQKKATLQTAYDTDNDKLVEVQGRLADAEATLAGYIAEKGQLMQQLLDATAASGGADLPAEGRTVQGSQISSIPIFDGSPGTDGEAWIRLVDRAKDQFGWSSRQTAQTARNRLTGDARLFVDNNEIEGLRGLDDWDEGDENLRAMLVDKFGFTYSAATAAHALEDLKQSTGETVDQFYERVRLAVSKFLADMEKTGAHQATYANMFQRLTFTHFKGGIFGAYRQSIYTAPTERQPNTPRALLEAARVVELEAGKSKKDVVYKKVNEVSKHTGPDEPRFSASAGAEKTEEDDKPAEEKPEGAVAQELQELKKSVEALNKKVPNPPQRGGRGRGNWRGGRGRGRGGGRWQRGRGRGGGGRGACNGCGAFDHWWRECPQNAQNGAQGAWPPHQGGPAFNPYRGRGRGGFPFHNNEITFSDDGFFDGSMSGNF